ncbi:MAG: hypothetical protein K9I70_10040 [Chitinophagaceae bacterium]|nr:hypothetical protein [Chitinophagaceae bacterium]
MVKKYFLLILIGCSLTSINAQQRKYVNDYLNLGVGGRGTGMSGAQIASVNDVTSAFWNPAGISYVPSDLQVGLMHSEYFSGIAKYDYLGTAFPMKNNKGVIGVSLIRYAIDDIPYTLDLIQRDGTVDYTKIKAISSQDYAGLISFAQPLKLKRFAGRDDADIRIGGNLKIIHRSIGSMANAWGAGLDLGAQAKIGRWKLGAVIKDITTTYTLWSFSFTEKEKQVLTETGNDIVSKSTEMATPRIILGAGRNFPLSKKISLLAELNTDITTDGKRYGNLINVKPFSVDPRIGAELSYKKLLYLRAGLGNFQRVLNDNDTSNTKKTTLFQPTLGLGVKIKNFAIDYSFSSLNIQSSALYSHFISLRIDINKKSNTLATDDIFIDNTFRSKAKSKS